MLRAQFGRHAGDPASRRLDGRRQGVEELVDRVTTGEAPAQWCDEDLRVGGGWDDNSVPAVSNSGDCLAGTVVMRVVRIEHGDHDPRVENGYGHSRRSSSRYPSG